MLRDAILTLLIPPALVYALLSAPGAVLVLNWIWFQRPYSYSYDFWARLPIFQITFAITFISTVARGQFRLKGSPILGIYLILMFWLTISALFAFSPPVAWSTYREFLPSMWLSPILIYATINDLDLLKKVLWVAAGGLGLNAFKAGIATTARGGVLLTQISGFVGDNNVFGLTLCLAVAILIGLRSTLPRRRWISLAFYTYLTFIVLCIIYTKSRGALLSLLIVAFGRAVVSRNRIRNTILVLIAAGLAFLAVPDRYFNRLHTLDDLRADTSFMGRVQNWELSWREALRHPLVGVGPGNHVIYNQMHPHSVVVRVAHSIYFQTLGELGFPALFLYVLFVCLSLRMLISTCKYMADVVQEHPDLIWVRDVASWMACGYVAYVIGSAFLNMFYIEFPWYVPFYGSMLRPLVQKELARRGNATDSVANMFEVGHGA
jgi:putative inorganic carbon (HCO3(-)) transporter